MKKFNLYNITLLTWLVIATEAVLGLIFFSIYFFIFMASAFSGEMETVAKARLENPEYIWFLLAVPAFAVFWILNAMHKNAVIQRFAALDKLPALGNNFSTLGRYLQYFFLRNALFFAVVGLCNPQYGTGKTEAKRSGIEIMIALDVSNSMLAEDMGGNGNRLTHAKRAIERLISQLHGDKIGLVVFAGDAFVQIPLTTDYAAAKLFLGAVSTDMLSAQGTSIARAVNKSVESFDLKSKTQKVIVVISDGEDHEEDAVAAVENAVNNKIKVYTIGVGSTKGSPIPQYTNGIKDGVKRDQDGNTVITKLNQEMLKELAVKGKGSYVKTNKSNFGLEKLFNEINSLEKSTFDIAEFDNYDDQYMYFIWIAFICFVVEFILGYLPVFTA